MNPVCRRVLDITPHGKAMLSFSCGKDSWAAWLSARDTFEFTPYYLYLIPGLEFVEAYLDYAEHKLGTRIIRLPHPSLNRMLNRFVFQPPERCAVIEAAALPEYDFTDIADAVRDIAGLPDDAFVASGVRAADSPIRRIALKKNGGVSVNRRIFYPCWDWLKDRLIDELKAADIKLPPDYLMFSRTFDGIDLRFLAPLRQHYPRDYQRILDWFPLADMELARYEIARRH